MRVHNIGDVATDKHDVEDERRNQCLYPVCCLVVCL